MPQKFEKPFWRTLDGLEFATLKEAEAHEAANYHLVLANLTAFGVQAAIALAPESAHITAAIERAAIEIKRNRRARETARVEPAPGEQPGTDA